MAKMEIFTIVRKNDECVIYNEDGMFCSWTDIKKFNFDVIAETKAQAKENDIVLLVDETEAQNEFGDFMKMENHQAWFISRDIIWILQGRIDPRQSELKLVNFIRSHQI